MLTTSSSVQESDLTFRLASGLVIWQPMWEHRQPDIPAFAALIKPVRNIVTGEQKKKSSLTAIYLFVFVLKSCVVCLHSQEELPSQQPVQPLWIWQPRSHGEGAFIAHMLLLQRSHVD